MLAGIWQRLDEDAATGVYIPASARLYKGFDLHAAGTAMALRFATRERHH
jgi:hypothetical protein